jgi:thiamine biosynthesis lipoprotein ApbE
VLAESGRVVELRDRSLSVSAQRGRGHVIDPRSGAVIASRALAWAVAREARVAEAWSTAILVLGRTDVEDERLLERGLEGER